MSMGIVDLVGRGLGCERSGIVSNSMEPLDLRPIGLEIVLIGRFAGKEGRPSGQASQSWRPSPLLYRRIILYHLIHE